MLRLSSHHSFPYCDDFQGSVVDGRDTVSYPAGSVIALVSCVAQRLPSGGLMSMQQSARYRHRPEHVLDARYARPCDLRPP